MSIFKISFFDSDYGGMCIELTKEEFFEGTLNDATKYSESKRSLWGFKYKVGNKGHGSAVIKKITKEQRDTEVEIVALQLRLEKIKGG